VVIVGEVQIDCVSCFFGHVSRAVCEMDRRILYTHSSSDIFFYFLPIASTSPYE
jgi:hypothetical protein